MLSCWRCIRKETHWQEKSPCDIRYSKNFGDYNHHGWFWCLDNPCWWRKFLWYHLCQNIWKNSIIVREVITLRGHKSTCIQQFYNMSDRPASAQLYCFSIKNIKSHRDKLTSIVLLLLWCLAKAMRKKELFAWMGK